MSRLLESITCHRHRRKGRDYMALLASLRHAWNRPLQSRLWALCNRARLHRPPKNSGLVPCPGSAARQRRVQALCYCHHERASAREGSAVPTFSATCECARASSTYPQSSPTKRDGDRIAQHPSTALRAGSAKPGSRFAARACHERSRGGRTGELGRRSAGLALP